MIKCKTVLVKFVDRGSVGQEMTAAQQTDAQYIIVDDKNGFLTISYYHESGNMVKFIAFQSSTIREYYCERIIWPAARAAE